MADGSLYLFSCMICVICRVIGTFLCNIFTRKRSATRIMNKRKQVKPVKKPQTLLIVPELPQGWHKEEKIRKSGKTKGKKDVYLFSPSGHMFKSNKNVQLYMSLQKKKVHIPNVFSKKYGVQKDNAPVNVGEGSGRKVPEDGNAKKD